jgi:hypothetical protein
MEDAPAFIIKGDACTFVMTDRMGDASRFSDKRRRAPSSARLLYLNNQRHTIGTHVSLLSQKQLHLRYKLN